MNYESQFWFFFLLLEKGAQERTLHFVLCHSSRVELSCCAELCEPLATEHTAKITFLWSFPWDLTLPRQIELDQ